jgi:hypothetical protein
LVAKITQGVGIQRTAQRFGADAAIPAWMIVLQQRTFGHGFPTGYAPVARALRGKPQLQIPAGMM